VGETVGEDSLGYGENFWIFNGEGEAIYVV
jgi:hypothetical protein